MAIVCALALTGCKNANDLIGEQFIDYRKGTDQTTKAEATASINYTETEGVQKRGMRLFDNKKKGITVKIKMENVESQDKIPGNMGIVFDLTKNKADGTYNFGLVGICKHSNTLSTYIAYYENIKSSDFNASDFGTNDNTVVHSKACRTDIVDFTDISNKFSIDQNTISVGIQIKPMQSKNAGNIDTFDASNAYKIFFYDASETTIENIQQLARGTLADQSAAAKIMYNVKKSQIYEDESGVNKVIENKMGFYARVAETKTLKGEWQVADMEHQPVEIIWADEEGKAAYLPYDTLGIN